MFHLVYLLVIIVLSFALVDIIHCFSFLLLMSFIAYVCHCVILYSDFYILKGGFVP